MKVKLTISRAHKVVERLNKLAAEASARAHILLLPVSVSGYAGEAQLADYTKRSEDGLAELGRFQKIASAVSEIRAAIAEVNATQGINRVLSDMEACNRVAHLIRGIVQAQPADGICFSALPAYTAFAPDNHRYGSVTVKSLTEGALSLLSEELKRVAAEANRLSDILADLNAYKLTISIPDDMAKDVGLA